MYPRPAVCASIAVLALTPLGLAAEPKAPSFLPAVAKGDWPWWRGPALDGVSPDKPAVAEWSPTKNVVWRADVPGRGHSSPVLWGDRLFLTTADEQGQTQRILAFDRKTGKPLWDKTAHEKGFIRKHQKNSHASATPACDGRRLYCAFVNADGLHVTATGLDGGILWQKKAGPYTSEHGYGSSPVLYKGLVIVDAESLKGSFLAALHADSGEAAWKVDRRVTGKHGSYGTPVVATLAGKPQLIVAGTGDTTSYHPETGEVLWRCAGPAEVTGCTPAFNDKIVFSSGGFPEKELLAIRADGKGDVSKSHVAWRTGKGVTYVPSPLHHDGRLYVINDGGTATCFEAEGGKVVWQDRLPGAFSSSPVLAGGLIFVTSEAGKTYVLKAGNDFEVVAANDLGEPTFATPAVAGGRIYLRTVKGLYCIGKD